jgi:hypothetical protein
MSFYPPWLDYLAYALAIAAALVGWAVRSQPVGLRRGRLKLTALLFLSTAILLGAVDAIVFNTRAPRLTAQGIVSNVAKSHGRNSYTVFSLTTSTGEIDGLQLGSVIDQIVNNESAVIIYQAGSNKVLQITITNGFASGYTTSRSDGMTGSVAALIAGIIVLAYAILNFLSDGQGTPPPSSSEFKPAPDGEVDTKSIIQLDD